LFVATSGISTSGLSVVDVGSYYSVFGQIVLMTIFQVGGIGYMVFVVSMFRVLNMKIPLHTRIVAKESLASEGYHQIGRFFLSVFLYTALFELAGMLFLSLLWREKYGFSKALYMGLFHSVSTFCTAGFALFPDNLMRYRDSVGVNLVVNVISLAGGIGFFVMNDLCGFLSDWVKNVRPRRLCLHTKMVFGVSAFVIALGTVIILLAEPWPMEWGLFRRVQTASFQAISASTTDGFNTVDIGALGTTSLLVLMALMFIGASPGSTGGGIKTTTLGSLFVFMRMQMKGPGRAVSFNREIPLKILHKSIEIFMWFVMILAIDLVWLGWTEKATFIQIMFEIISALGNTGLSMGITSGLSAPGKWVLIVTMFIGRVGPATLSASVWEKEEIPVYRYAREELFIG